MRKAKHVHDIKTVDASCLIAAAAIIATTLPRRGELKAKNSTKRSKCSDNEKSLEPFLVAKRELCTKNFSRFAWILGCFAASAEAHMYSVSGHWSCAQTVPT